MFIDECAICQFVGPVNYCATRLIGTSWLVMNGNVGFCNHLNLQVERTVLIGLSLPISCIGYHRILRQHICF